jgi:hypothetical protein
MVPLYPVPGRTCMPRRVSTGIQYEPLYSRKYNPSTRRMYDFSHYGPGSNV